MPGPVGVPGPEHQPVAPYRTADASGGPNCADFVAGRSFAGKAISAKQTHFSCGWAIGVTGVRAAASGGWRWAELLSARSHRRRPKLLGARRFGRSRTPPMSGSALWLSAIYLILCLVRHGRGEQIRRLGCVPCDLRPHGEAGECPYACGLSGQGDTWPRRIRPGPAQMPQPSRGSKQKSCPSRYFFLDLIGSRDIIHGARDGVRPRCGVPQRAVVVGVESGMCQVEDGGRMMHASARSSLDCRGLDDPRHCARDLPYAKSQRL